ncbi:MAG TPA: hypothetical protein VN962_00005, partial [Polyangia bacterium]|nr:hypothetical protein [Polyangia bacterium]
MIMMMVIKVTVPIVMARRDRGSMAAALVTSPTRRQSAPEGAPSAWGKNTTDAPGMLRMKVR